jgi:hypothetical protein
MDHAFPLRTSPLRFGRRRGAATVAAGWPDDAVPFFFRCWLGATTLILMWIG